jgi:cytochrome c
VITFIVHIAFVLLMVSGSLFTLAYEIRGLQKPEYDRLSREIGKTLTVNKSLAVVLGVGVLLIVNTLYTVYFYTANALTGTAWIMIILLVIAAFLLSYAHKYSWDLLADRKGLHISLAAGAAVLFLFIPLIFLANINLMLYPEQWAKVHGFLSSLLLPNVLPRYLHFLAATVAVTAFFLVWYFGREAFPAEEVFPKFTKQQLRRHFYGVAFAATAAQLFFGPLLYLTLPAQTISWAMTLVIFTGASLAVGVLFLLWKGSREVNEPAGFRFWAVAGLLLVTVAFMATGRHMVRENAIRPHRALVEAKTMAYMKAVSADQNFLIVPGGMGGTPVPAGESVFKKVCGACHAGKTRLVGPPITLIQATYKDNPAGIVAWAKSPYDKLAGYPPMPPQHLPEDQLKAVAEFLLTPRALDM